MDDRIETIKEYFKTFGYELLSYKKENNEEIVEIKNILCGHILITSYKNFRRRKNKNKCKECLEEQEFEECKKIGEKKGYKVIRLKKQEYRKILLVQCDRQHDAYWVRLDHFKNGHGCKECANEDLVIYNEEYIKKYVKKHNQILLEITNFNYADSTVKVWCGKKGHKPRETSIRQLRRTDCYQCSMVVWTDEKIKQFVENEGYEYLEKIDGVGYRAYIKVCCKKHEPYKVRFSKFKEGTRCPYCNESKGEKEISRILDKYKIKYKTQYKFDDCKFYKKLPFDFYLFTEHVLIEYDGALHFEIVDYFGGVDKFIDIKIRDTIKNIYCQQNNIKLIRIPYWDFDNIEKILIKELNLK